MKPSLPLSSFLGEGPRRTVGRGEGVFWLIAIMICVLGIILRFAHLTDTFQFAFDQSRDALRVMEIAGGHLKIVGPETDIRGVFNGPFFYYLLAIPYLLSGFDPNAAAICMTIVNLLAAILMMWFAFRLTRSKLVSVIALLLWMVSTEQLNYARYISNASLMGPTTLAFFYLMFEYIQTKKWWVAALAGLMLGLAIHANFYLIYLGIVLISCLLFSSRHHWSLAIVTCILTTSHLIIAEIKWKFTAVQSLLVFFIVTGEEKEQMSFFTRLFDSLHIYLERMSSTVQFNLSPSVSSSWIHLGTFALLLAYFLIHIRNRTQKTVVLAILFSNVLLFYFRSGVLTVPVINSTIVPGLYLLVAIVLADMIRSHLPLRIIGIACGSIILYANISHTIQNNFINSTMLSPVGLKWADTKQTIDYVYTSGHDVSICALTNPLFINANWSFAFKTYGEKKYGHLPSWIGQPQYFTHNYLTEQSPRTPEVYLILEPDNGYPAEATDATLVDADQHSELIEEKTFSSVRVQKRRIITTRPETIPPDMDKKKYDNAIHALDVVPYYRCNYQYATL